MTRFKQHTEISLNFINKKLKEFFIEDSIDNDITTEATQQSGQKVFAQLIAKEQLVFAGKEIVVQGFSECIINDIVNDGSQLEKGNVIATMYGKIDIILKKERVILNLIQRLSGIASTTHKLSKITKPYDIELLDTRKTTPGLRLFEKFAVSVGGGTNHRFSLKEAIMIKDNHLIGNPDILESVSLAKRDNPNKDIQLEVDTVEQLDIALESEASSILLDNFEPKKLPSVIKKIKSHPKGKNMYIELSGGISANTLSNYCIHGVNGISMGALTHNIKSKDISLDIK